MSKSAVVALGGNAFTRSGQAGTYEEQHANAVAMAQALLTLRRAGWDVVVVHGNGPQVGTLAIQQEEGRRLVPAQPLFALGAMTQGEIGSLLGLALRALAPETAVAALVTHVVVAADDPAFTTPTKPIGPFFDRRRSEELAGERGWAVVEDAGRGFRRVVASPGPRRIVEAETIRSLVSSGTIVVAGGGGGVPVVSDGGVLRGVEAVIDKDYVAGELAAALSARALVFVTDVPQLMVDFGRPTQRPVQEIDLATLERHHAEGQFPAGSMGPKVESAIRFLRAGGETVVISTTALAARTLTGATAEAGTRIVAARGAPMPATAAPTGRTGRSTPRKRSASRHVSTGTPE